MKIRNFFLLFVILFSYYSHSFSAASAGKSKKVLKPQDALALIDTLPLGEELFDLLQDADKDKNKELEIALYEKVLQRKDIRNNLGLFVDLSLNLSMLYYDHTNQIEQAIKHTKSAYSLSRNNLGFLGLHMKAAYLLGLMTDRVNPHDPHIESYLNEALSIASSLKNRMMVGDASNSLANYYNTNNQIDKAIDSYKKAYEAGNILAFWGWAQAYLYGTNLVAVNYAQVISVLTDEYSQEKRRIQQGNPPNIVSVERINANGTIGHINMSLLESLQENLIEAKGIIVGKVQELYGQIKINPQLKLIKSAQKILSQASNIPFIPGNDEHNQLLNRKINEYKTELQKLEHNLKHPSASAAQPAAGAGSSSQQTPRENLDELLTRAQQTLVNNDLDSVESTLQQAQAIDKNKDMQKKFDAIYEQFVELKYEQILQQFNQALIDYKKKPLIHRFNEAQELIFQASRLAAQSKNKLKNAAAVSTLRKELYQQRDRIHEAQNQTASAQEVSEQESQEQQTQEPYILLDPFEQLKEIPNERLSSFNVALESLQNAPLANKDAKKIKGFKKLWRIRIGVYRLTYTVHPENKVIVIIAIDKRKDIYENDEQDKHRQAWFEEYAHMPLHDLAQAIARKNQANHQAEERALIQLYLQKAKDSSAVASEQYETLQRRLEVLTPRNQALETHAAAAAAP